MENKIFKLSHVVLYTKGWYEKSDNIWADLSTVLSSQYDENWFCAVFTVFENNRPYQACISFDVMTLYYKKE